MKKTISFFISSLILICNTSCISKYFTKNSFWDEVRKCDIDYGYNSVGEYNLNNRPIDEILKEVSFEQKFEIDNGNTCSWTAYPDSLVYFSLEKDQTGFTQPTIILEPKYGSSEKISVSKIKGVRIFEDSNKLRINYWKESQSNHYAQLMDYKLYVQNDSKKIGLLLKELSKKYAALEEIFKNGTKSPPSSKKESVAVKEISQNNCTNRSFYLAQEVLSDICNETERGKSLAQFIGTVEFEDCTYSPADAHKANDLIEKIKNIYGTDNIFVYCGNSDKRSASKCPSNYPDPSNVGLSWDRANNLVEYNQKNNLQSLHIPFPNKTNSDKRSVDVYLMKRN